VSQKICHDTVEKGWISVVTRHPEGGFQFPNHNFFKGAATVNYGGWLVLNNRTFPRFRHTLIIFTNPLRGGPFLSDFSTCAQVHEKINWLRRIWEVYFINNITSTFIFNLLIWIYAHQSGCRFICTAFRSRHAINHRLV
jgi:hypothetical protein